MCCESAEHQFTTFVSCVSSDGHFQLRPVLLSSMQLSQVGLDYCNSLPAGLTDELTNKLQSVLHSAARLVLRILKFDHITDDTHDQLPWLPIRQRIQYKLGVLVYKCLHGAAPSYLADMISPVGNGSQRLYDRPLMEILLFLQHGQFAWAHGVLQSMAQQYGTRCR